ncbi:MAG: hypothetical protein H6757_02980 [Candidatus Omnitrophica bacterium]|nr:hypothetical protein [Candidatus Omnitrophota bacterium]
MKKTNVLYLVLGVMLFGLNSCSTVPSATLTSDERENYRKSSDVILTAEPIKVTAIRVGQTIDAIEGSPEEIGLAQAVVLFRIERVLKGDFTKVKTGGASVTQQALQAIKQKEILKVLTLDFKDPDEIIQKEWLSIAVRDPEILFLIPVRMWDSPRPEKFKLYLKRMPEDPSSYLFLGRESVK